MMQSLIVVLAVVVGGFLLLMVGMNMFVRMRAQAMQGQPVPEVPGLLGKSLTQTRHALVYFFSPSCAACRHITPRLQQMREKNKSVHVVDITQQLDVARALRVMATPSTVEIEDGKIVGVHIGMPPAELMERFAA